MLVVDELAALPESRRRSVPKYILFVSPARELYARAPARYARAIASIRAEMFCYLGKSLTP